MQFFVRVRPFQKDDPVPDAEELKSVETFLTTNLKVEQPGLQRVFRMGKKRSPTDRPRPLKVMFQSSVPRSQTLDSARSLGKLPEHHPHRKVYIRPDWTKMQRDHDYQKRQASRPSRARHPHGDGDNSHPTESAPTASSRQESDTPSSPKLLLFNARSIGNKQSELNSFIHSKQQPDIVAITETWLNDKIKFTALSNDYNVFRQDRLAGNGGGVLLALKHNLRYKFVDKFSDYNCECVIVDVQIDNSNFMRYVVVYRPPDTNVDNSKQLFDKLYTYIESIKYFTFVGDFNFPDINWENFSSTCPVSREFVSFCLKSGLHQLVNFSTRGNNILDLVLCSNLRFMHELYADIPFSTSDHN